MSNGQLIRDINKCNRIIKKKNNKLKNNSNTSKNRLKNAASEDKINETVSAANPFIWKKDINTWLTDEGLLYLQSWANDGLSNGEIAKKMGINESTLYRWCNTDARIKTAITRGRDTMTMEVENTLYKCAQGYYYEEETVTKEGFIVKIQRYQPPSAEAQKFILTNRRKDKWKSKNEVALEAQVAAQAQVQATTKVVTAEDVAKSIIGDESASDDFDFPDIPDDVVDNV